MQTLRGRLTAWYSGALALTLAAFAGVLYLDRRSASYQDLDQRIRSEASLTAGILAESYRARGTLVRADTAQHPVLIPDLAALLEAVPGFLVITARDGSLLFASSDARALTLPQVEQLRSLGSTCVSGRSWRLLRIRDALSLITAHARDESHTPLTVLRAGVERAITSHNLPQDPLATLEETLQEIKRMTELVDALLTLAGADEGIAPLHRAPVDLRGIVEEVRETGELLAEESGVRVEVATPPEPMVVSVDATRIRQLILNLLTNAVKYTPPGGTVRMQLGAADGRVTLSVADTGIGIAPGDLPHIFDRFWRADSARTRTGERSGAGLGLAICKWIAEAHGGQIEVVSRPGRGTTFTVTLPREAQPPQS